MYGSYNNDTLTQNIRKVLSSQKNNQSKQNEYSEQSRNSVQHSNSILQSSQKLKKKVVIKKKPSNTQLNSSSKKSRINNTDRKLEKRDGLTIRSLSPPSFNNLVFKNHLENPSFERNVPTLFNRRAKVIEDEINTPNKNLNSSYQG
jgi:hypothetical protein